MNNEIIKTIGKYALILTIFYLIDIAVGRYTNFIIDNAKSRGAETLLASLPMIVSYFLNIVTAILISFDKTKFSLTGKYSVLLTIIYRPIGIVLFLIYLINSEIKSESTYNSKS